ncbi:MAG: glycosyltransferase family 39 protein [Elusimicrobiota bacterium]
MTSLSPGTGAAVPAGGAASAAFLGPLLALFICASSYAYGILTVPRPFYSTVTLGFLAALLAVFLVNLARILRADESALGGELRRVLLCAGALHCALILGFYLSGHPQTALWVEDSYHLHIPGAVNVAAYIHGREALGSIGVPFGGVFLTQALVGVFFSFLGASPVVSAAVLALVKLLAVVVLFRLGRMMFGERAGLIGALLYVFSPTILYYTTVFYKEAVIQLVVAALLLAALRIYRKAGGWGDWLLLAASLAALINERFYLFFFFLLALIPPALHAARSLGRFSRAGAALLAAACFSALAYKYMGWVNAKFGPLNSSEGCFFSGINNLRALYNGFPDVSSVNSTLAYPFAFLKILFTPFFTMNKFQLFSDYSYILIWGSFFNQAVIALSLYGLYKALRADWRTHGLLLFPYFLFLCIFAYVAPFNGRLRDSFYPLITIYAAYSVSKLYSVLSSRRGRCATSRPPALKPLRPF